MTELLKKAMEVAKANKGTLAEFTVGVPVVGVLAEQIAVVDSLPVKCVLGEVILGIFAVYCVYRIMAKKAVAK